MDLGPGLATNEHPSRAVDMILRQNEALGEIFNSKFMMRVTRQTLRSQDFLENLQKTLFATFSDAAKKPSKNPKKTFRRPRKF